MYKRKTEDEYDIYIDYGHGEGFETRKRDAYDMPYVRSKNRKQGTAMKIIFRVWGIAEGIGSTKDAAAGAFTWKEYDKPDIPKRDWRAIIAIEKDKEA